MSVELEHMGYFITELKERRRRFEAERQRFQEACTDAYDSATCGGSFSDTAYYTEILAGRAPSFDAELDLVLDSLDRLLELVGDTKVVSAIHTAPRLRQEVRDLEIQLDSTNLELRNAEAARDEQQDRAWKQEKKLDDLAAVLLELKTEDLAAASGRAQAKVSAEQARRIRDHVTEVLL